MQSARVICPTRNCLQHHQHPAGRLYGYSLDNMMSQPPTNSPLTYTWGIVGQSLTGQLHIASQRGATHLYSLMPSRNSGSSRQLKDTICSRGTPCTSRIWQTAREKPHWGASGVPFMKTTNGFSCTA